MVIHFDNSMVYDLKEVKRALKVLENGSSNKWKYVQAKDLICRVAQIYVWGGIRKIETYHTLPMSEG